MLNPYLSLLFIQFIIVIIVDVTDFPSTLKRLLSRILTRNQLVTDNYRAHLLDCSLCINTWTSLIYLLITHQMTLPLVAFVFLLSASTSVTKEIYFTFTDIIIKLLSKMVNLFDGDPK